MSRSRKYWHYCPVARALETLGSRWTVLILRELGTGPKRYTDLMQRLAGIGPSLLAERIHELEDDGLIRKEQLPPPAGSRVYVLTESGLSTIPLLRAMARFGSQYLPTAMDGPEKRRLPIWLADVLLTRLQPDTGKIDGAVEFHDGAVEFHIDEEVFHLHWRNGEPWLTLGEAWRPVLVIRGDRPAMGQRARGRVSRRLRWRGKAWRTFADLFAIEDRTDRKEGVSAA